MISINNLSFSYTSNPPYLLDGLSLEVPDGEYLSVLGENGSGKSTLIRLILGLIRPSKGEIRCRAERIGYVPQKSDFLNSQFPITVREMLDSYRRIIKVREKDAVGAILRQVRMEEYAGAIIGTLSGGQLQKVFIARALLGAPPLLVLDEPSTGVDVSSQQEIYALLRSINRENGVTIIAIEHNLDAAIRNSTRIFHLAGGNGHLCTPDQYAAEYLHRNGG